MQQGPPEEKEEQKFCQKYAENIRDCLVDSLNATEAVILEIGEILHRRQIFRANVLPGLPPSSGLPALPMVPELHARTVLPAIEQNSSLHALPIMSSSSMLSSTPPRSGTRHSLNVSPTVQEINHLLPSSSSSSSSTSLLQGPATSSTTVASNSATRSANQAELDDPTAKRQRLDETTPP